jgi:hypothetical protein
MRFDEGRREGCGHYTATFWHRLKNWNPLSIQTLGDSPPLFIARKSRSQSIVLVGSPSQPLLLAHNQQPLFEFCTNYLPVINFAITRGKLQLRTHPHRLKKIKKIYILFFSSTMWALSTVHKKAPPEASELLRRKSLH